MHTHYLFSNNCIGGQLEHKHIKEFANVQVDRPSHYSLFVDAEREVYDRHTVCSSLMRMHTQ